MEDIAVKYILENQQSQPDFIMNGIHFDRISSSYDTDINKNANFSTDNIKCWRIVDEKLKPIDGSINHFNDSETYIIEWDYCVEATGKKRGKLYFYWKGDKAVKGCSPLPDELETDSQPVARICQWSEPPVFLQLFQGTFIVHSFDDNDNNAKRGEPELYLLRGECDSEMHLYQVPCLKSSLRSRANFVCFKPVENEALIWYGNQSNPVCKKFIKANVEKVFGSKIKEVYEGSGENEFESLVKGTKSDYFYNTKFLSRSPRLFYFYHQDFEPSFGVVEVENALKSDYLTPFPFLQSHLYNTVQPALLILDDNNEIWIWQGWDWDLNAEFPKHVEIVKRICLKLAEEKSQIDSETKKRVGVKLVHAGLEPLEFTNLFPAWHKNEEVSKAQLLRDLKDMEAAIVE